MVRLFEEIIRDMREAFRDDEKLLEPLTEEEEEQQISDREASKMFFKKYSNNTGIWNEIEGIANKKRYKLDDNEAEKLR